MIALIAAAALQTAWASAAPTGTAAGTGPAAVEETLRQYDQALLDAIAPGDRAVWEKLLAPDAVYIDENGAIMHREEFLKTIVPLPAGAIGTIAITQYDVNVHGDVAMVVHADDERENYHGIPLRANYLMTETWLRQGGEWRLAMIHVYVVPKDPPAIPTPASSLNDYQGRYRAAADLDFVIRRVGDHLVGEREGRPSVVLAEETPDVFFIPGQPRSRKFFRRGTHNQIVDFVDRREGEDLIFVRVKR